MAGHEGLKKESHPNHYAVFPEDFKNESGDTEHEITELVDHDKQSEMFDSDVDLGVAPTERSEFIPPPTPESNGSWSNHGENVVDLREVRGEEIPRMDSPQLDLPGVFEDNATTNVSEPNVIEWRDSIDKEKSELPTPEELSTSSVEVPPLQQKVAPEARELNLSATSAEVAARPERIRNLRSVLGERGRELWQNMPENAKSIADGMYEGIYRIPGVNRIVAKAEIAWNQVWIDRKQDRVLELNDKVREIASETTTLNESEAALKESLEIIQSQGFTGTANIEKSLRQIASRKTELSEKKITFENKVSHKQESMNSFVEKRNEITDRMVSKYGERMKPLETKMENLRGLQDALEFQTAIMEADHADQMIEITKLDEKRTKVYDTLLSVGQLDKNGNHPVLRQFDEAINASKMKIAQAEAVVKAKKQDIEARINKTEIRANVHREKQREFNVIKERKLYHSETSSSTEFQEDIELEESEIGSGFAEEENLAESSRLSIGTFLDKWNEHLKDTVNDEKRKAALTIDKAAFLKGARWNNGKELDYEHFVKVLDGYYRMKKVDFKDKTEMSKSFKDAKIDKE